MSFFANILGGLNLGADWLLILVFLGVGFGYGILLGSHRLGLIALAGYFSYAISKAIPWAIFLGSKSVPSTNVQIFIFLAMILAIFFLAPHSGLNAFVRTGGRGRAGWWQLAVLGLVQIGFLTSAIISFLPAKALADLNPFFGKFFAEGLARFIWLVLPLLAMMVLKRRRVYHYGDDD